MAKVVVTEQADTDWDSIYFKLAKSAGFLTAEKYGRKFDDLYELLSRFPRSGPERAKLGINIRIGIVYPYFAI